MRRSGLTILAVTVLTACGVTNIVGIKGSGTMTSETRDVSGFSAVVLEGSGIVTIDLTDTESLTIEAEDNLIDHLTSEVANGTLTLGADQSISPTREIMYTITASSLDEIAIAGSGNIETGGISADHFEATISGSGTMQLTSLALESLSATISGSGSIDASGTAVDLDVSIPGSGTFSGDELEATNAEVDIGGSGNAVVNVSDNLDANVGGSGSVEYLGNPLVESTIGGSGSVRPR